MDNVNLIINRMFVANKFADIDFDSLISYPGNVILTNDVNALKALDTKDVTKSSYMEEDIIKKDIDNAAGEWAYNRGEPPQRRETATGIVRLQQASNIRFDTIVKMLEFTVLRNIAKMFLWLDYQFLDRNDFSKIVREEDFVARGGDRFYQQDILEILRLYNFQPMGSATTAVKEVRIQQMMQTFQLFNNDPFINQWELRKALLDALDNKNNKLLLSPQQLQQTASAQVQGQGQPVTGGSPGVNAPPQPPGLPSPGQTPSENAVGELAAIAGGGLVQGPAKVPGAESRGVENK
jgi:hypothetical protein